MVLKSPIKEMFYRIFHNSNFSIRLSENLNFALELILLHVQISLNGFVKLKLAMRRSGDVNHGPIVIFYYPGIL